METSLKERPILFSAPMVRAILAGQKTQTRRAVNPQPFADPNGHGWQWHGGPALERAGYGARYIHCDLGEHFERAMLAACPLGQPGDRLWVRENCRAEELEDGLDGVRYADDGFQPIENSCAAAEAWVMLNHYGSKRGKPRRGRTVPSIHMPRWASRITLEITGVRVERLQAIRARDAIAEGIPAGGPENPDEIEVREFRALWESIYGVASWEANPWMWVIDFKHLEAEARDHE